MQVKNNTQLQLIRFLGNCNAHSFFIKGKRNTTRKYITQLNGIKNPLQYLDKLNRLLTEFQIELINLPITSSPESYVPFFRNLSFTLDNIKKQIESRDYIIKFKYPTLIDIDTNNLLSRDNSEFKDSKSFQDYKIRIMWMWHQQYCQQALDILNEYKINYGIEEYNKQNSQRFLVNTSINETALLFLTISEQLAVKPINRKELANFLATNIQTKKTTTPSVQQIYKAFYNKDPLLRQTIKQLLKDLWMKM